ncbi:ABC transporter ATP-binding protein [bacterium]|nr:ABC transporter ATP-binding protein [bacterium]
MELIRLCGVSKTYCSDGVPVTALHPTDLVVEQGEFACIAGPSGSGKTTLLNLIGGIDIPTQGTVSIAGQRTTGLGRTRAAALRLNRIGFIFQAHNLIPVLTAYENVEYVLLLKGVAAEERRERVTAALGGVGLADKMGKRPNQMSGGEQQRVAVARAIVDSPPLVLADEPTASLDSTTGEELVNLLHSLNDRAGTTFVFSSHDPRIIERAGRVITLHDGSVVADERR